MAQASTSTPSVAIGTPKQIAYARDIFAKRGAFIRAQRSSQAAVWRLARGRIGETAPWGVMTDEMADRADALAAALDGGAESRAVYWIEDMPSDDILVRYVATGVVSPKMTDMGLARVG